MLHSPITDEKREDATTPPPPSSPSSPVAGDDDGGRDGGADTPRTNFSTLPELAHSSSLPEISEKFAPPPPLPGPHTLLPRPYPGGYTAADLDLSAYAAPVELPSASERRRERRRRTWGWFGRRRNIVLVVLLAALVVIGVSVGVAVPLSRRASSGGNAQGSNSGGGGGNGGGDGGGTGGGGGDGGGGGGGSGGSGSGGGGGSSGDGSFFGTPISLDGEPPALTCQGTMCPQVLAATRFGSTSPTFFFARGTDGAIWYREIGSSAWDNDWTSLGGEFLSQPTVASMREGRVDVFATWTDQSIRFKTFQNGVWDEAWTTLGGKSASPPVTCSLYQDNLQVVVVDESNRLYQKYANGNNWAPALVGRWEDLGGWSSGSPDIGCVAVSDKVQRLDLVAFGNGTSHGMFFKRWNSTDGWEKEWSGGKGSFVGNPTIVSTPKEVNYFGVGEDGTMWVTSWTSAGGYKEPVSLLGGGFLSSPTAVATESMSRLDVLAIGSDTRLRHLSRLHGLWGTQWEDLGGVFNSAPKVIVLNSTSVGVFGVGPNGTIIHSTFNLGTGYLWGAGQWYSDGGSMTSKWHGSGTT